MKNANIVRAFDSILTNTPNIDTMTTEEFEILVWKTAETVGERFDIPTIEILDIVGM